MAKREVLVLNKSAAEISRIQAAQSGDTYLLPRQTYTTTGEFTSEVTAGGSAQAFTFDTGSNYRGTAGAQMFTVENNGTLEFSVAGDSTSAGATIISGNSGTANKFRFSSQGAATAGVLDVYANFGVVTTFLSPSTLGFIFESAADDSGSAKTGISFVNNTLLTNSGSVICRFANTSTGPKIEFNKDGGVKADDGLGIHGKAIPAQHSSTGSVSISAAGATNTVYRNTQFDGVGSGTGYTVGDIVKCLKDIGALAA